MNKLKKADVDDDIILKYRKRIIRKKDIIDTWVSGYSIYTGR